jgi:hypothetical protein
VPALLLLPLLLLEQQARVPAAAPVGEAGHLGQCPETLIQQRACRQPEITWARLPERWTQQQAANSTSMQVRLKPGYNT